MVHTSNVVLAAITLGVVSTLAAPVREIGHLDRRDVEDDVELFARGGRMHKKHHHHHHHHKAAEAPTPAERRDIDDVEEMIARDEDEVELFARGRGGRRHKKHHHHHHKAAAAPPVEAPAPAGETPAARRDVQDDFEEMVARDEDEVELFARGGHMHKKHHHHHHHHKAAEAPTPAERRDIDDVEEMIARDEDEVELFARGRGGRRHKKHHHHHHHKAAAAPPVEAPAPAGETPAARRDIQDDFEEMVARDEDEVELFARGRGGRRHKKHHHHHKAAAAPAPAADAPAPETPPGRRDIQDEYLFVREIDELD
jgi:DNA replication initiation complex subunit (GINS family)